jgi:CheY-like chemotaxis protein
VGKEQRLYERLDFNCPCACALLDSFPETFSATIIDIGPQGIGFVCQEPLKVGTSILCSIDLGDGQPVKFIVKIRWSSKIANTDDHRYGAKIFNASPEDLEKIVRFYCKRLAPPKREKKTILVIEGDRTSVDLIEKSLTASSFDVVIAKDGESGFAEYRFRQPDLIILAVQLPGLDGIEVRRRIRKLQDDRTTPILMLAANTKEARQHERKYSAAQKFFVKPFKTDELIIAVKELLKASKK